MGKQERHGSDALIETYRAGRFTIEQELIEELAA
jgi:hypothetical protein